MKTIARFLGLVLCVAPLGVANAAVVATTAGDNLTAYNGNAGALNNNRWNTMINSRTGGNTAVADFGNCNAVIMRCAQPKCANGGCADMTVTAGIVSGCVQSNAACKQYGDDLVQYISAQLVASSTAKANAAANAAQTAAAQAAAAQSAQQMAAMQQQMQQMQSEMAAQNAQTVAQLQNALNEQKQLTANAIAEASAARDAAAANAPVQAAPSDLTSAQINAAQNGVSSDVLAREQITGQIMSSIENAETQLKALKATMTDVFNYAGCDSRGNNCTGPKRVKTFKQKAEGFFDPYENVLDELYDALILAQSVGVDITDIYMMLNGSCNVWGQYLCGSATAGTKMVEVCDKIVKTKAADGIEIEERECHDVAVADTGLITYDETTCPDGTSRKGGRVRGGHACVDGGVVPPEDDAACTLNKTIVDNKDDPVQRDWLWAESNSDTGANIRVGCASTALETSGLFRNRKKQATIDIETLQRMIAQDAPTTIRRSNYGVDNEQLKYCAITEPMYANLQKLVTTKTLPTKDLCIDEKKLNKNMDTVFLFNDESLIEKARQSCSDNKGDPQFSEVLYRCFCEKNVVEGVTQAECDSGKSQDAMRKAEEKLCREYGGVWTSSDKCDCSKIEYDENKASCETKFRQ